MAVPFAWTLARFLFKVVAPTVPEIVSAVARIKSQQIEDEAAQESMDKRVAELEKSLVTHVLLIEQLTTQIQVLQKIVTVALYVATGGLLVSLVVLGILLFR